MNTITTKRKTTLMDFQLEGIDLASPNIVIEPTPRTPFVNYNLANRELTIKGLSLEVDMHKFYSPIISRLKNDLASLRSFSVHVSLEDLNSSTAKVLFDLFNYFKNAIGAGKTVDITWEAANSEMLETGMDLAEFINIDLNFVSPIAA